MQHCWPRGLWLRMQRMAMRHIKRTNLRLVPREEAQAALQSPERVFGCGIFHLAPKDGGNFRSIHNLTKAPAPSWAFGQTTPVNTSLKPLFQYLTAVCRRVPSLHGTSVSGLAQAHERWRGFVSELRSGGSGRGWPGSSALHFSSTDINNCYDTIDQATRHARLC